MLKNIFGKFSKDLGVDLGTANTLVYVKDKGIVIDEPSVVAINEKTNQIIAIGQEAKIMIGKTPPHIVATKPLTDGIVSDFEAAEKMMKHFIEKVHRETFTIMPRPRIVISIPLGITEVERKAVEDAALNAGARQVFLIEEPIAAAIGARLPISDAAGNLIVDIGGGTTEIAVISLGGVVTWRSLKLAGDELNKNIVTFMKERHNLLIGEKTAEDLKMKIGSCCETDENISTKVKGRDLLTGLPKEMDITSVDIREAMKKTIYTIVENIKSTIEETPPELVSDIFEKGIVLSGGGALLGGLDERIKQETGIPVSIVDDPLTCVVRGCGLILEDIEALKDIFAVSTHERI